jgi:E3 ubiquitin-protein ligase synoviolin
MDKGNPSEIIVSCIFATEVIFMQMKLYVKFIKLSIDLTELKMQKEWEHKKVLLHIINLIRYVIKVLIEIKFCGLTIKTGIFPIYLFIDGFYSIWHVTKQGYKLWEYISLRRIIKNLDNYDSSLNQGEGEGEAKNQCICLDEVKVGKKLPCGHVFHEACIK